MTVYSDHGGFLYSGMAVSGLTGDILDLRSSRNYGYLYVASTQQSANVTIRVSHDESAWMTYALYTASTTTATAQVAGMFPYMQAIVNLVYSGSNLTGSPVIHYTPGIG